MNFPEMKPEEIIAGNFLVCVADGSEHPDSCNLYTVGNLYRVVEVSEDEMVEDDSITDLYLEDNDKERHSWSRHSAITGNRRNNADDVCPRFIAFNSLTNEERVLLKLGVNIEGL